jgi:hypothetical protein
MQSLYEPIINKFLNVSLMPRLGKKGAFFKDLQLTPVIEYGIL